MSGSPYKYIAALAVIPDCPPGHCAPKHLTAYRFVYSPDPANESFLPQGKKKPARMFEGDNETRCSLMALSIFTTTLKAKRKYKTLARKYDARALLGTHIAAVAIDPTHGLVSPPSKSGHMDLHEFQGCDLATVAQIVEEL
jgi:hypothetical protein